MEIPGMLLACWRIAARMRPSRPQALNTVRDVQSTRNWRAASRPIKAGAPRVVAKTRRLWHMAGDGLLTVSGDVAERLKATVC